MTLYAESSAVLAWLLGEPTAAAVAAPLRSAELIVASDLTWIECHRVLVRAVALAECGAEDAARRSALLRRAAAGWRRLRLSAAISRRARQPFPAEPLRTLDAIHLASALAARATLGEVELLSLDDRVRRAGAALGFRLLPG